MLPPLLLFLGAMAGFGLSAGIVSRARPKRNFNRKKLAGYSYPAQPALTYTVTLVSSKMRITANVPLVVSAVPTEITANGLHATGYTIVSATVVDLSFAVAPVSTNPWVIPANVVEVRSGQGGMLASGAGTF
jgi:hypothetical protein